MAQQVPLGHRAPDIEDAPRVTWAVGCENRAKSAETLHGKVARTQGPAPQAANPGSPYMTRSRGYFKAGVRLL